MATGAGTILPLGNDVPSYKFKISLSGVVFTLALKFNTRISTWHLDLFDATNNPILNGLPLIIDTDFLYQFVDSRMPLGRMFARDNTGLQTQPSRNSFGTTHEVIYIDPLGVS